MKKTIIALVAAMAMAFTACNNQQAEEQQRYIDSLQTCLNQKDGEIDELFDLLIQIEENLSGITEKYSKVQNLRSGDVEGAGVKGEIAEQISNINDMLGDNKKKLASLNQKIAAQGKENSKLTEFVARLEEQIKEKEEQISVLMTELEQNKVVIAGLRENVSTLTRSNEEKDATIARHVEESNRSYFIVASAKELVEMGITDKGGLFKKGGAKADMNTDNFQCIDRSKVTTITVGKRGVKVLSKHPSDSYELVMDENDSKTVAFIKILNPTSFWRYTAYLVVSTK